MLVDTHTHAVSADVVRFPQRAVALANGAWWHDTDSSIENLTAAVAASPVDGVVLVQAAGPYGDDNSYLVESAGGPNVASVCIVNPMDPTASGQLATLAAQGIDGIRLFHVPTPAEPWLAAAETNALIDQAADLGLVIMACVLPDALDDLATQLARRPELPMVLDHCGFADFGQQLWGLAEHQNLHLKFTPTLARMKGGDPAELVAQLVEHFGAGRVLWGSDWPQHREPDLPTYADQVALIQSWLADLAPSDRDAIAGGNAQRLWPNSFHH